MDPLLERVLIVLLYGVGVLLTSIHILLRKKESRSAAIWLLTVVTMPALGIALYILFGVDRVRRRMLLKEAANLRLRQEYVAVHPRQQDVYSYPVLEGEDGSSVSLSLPDFPTVLERICARRLFVGNRIKLLQQGDQVYRAMLEAIDRAKSTINLQTYIFMADRVGRQIVESLLRASHRGVEVRMLYDPVGSVDALWFLDELAFTAVKVLPFTPLNPLKRRWQINLRNHRKLLVVDGQLAFTGGMNLCEKHLVHHPLLTRVKDYHFLVEGPVVHQMQEWFVEDWYYASSEKLLSKRFFPPLEWKGEDLARVITSGPDGDYEAFYQVAFAAIVGARSRIQIVSPYFIPDRGLRSALNHAAARGVEVTLMVPGHSDHAFVLWASRAFYEELLSYGVRIYERRPPFLHAKALLVDDDWALVGSANMDERSFRLNFEANLEVRSPTLTRALRVAIQDDLRSAVPIELATIRRQPWRRKLLERACGLLNPLL